MANACVCIVFLNAFLLSNMQKYCMIAKNSIKTPIYLHSRVFLKWHDPHVGKLIKDRYIS